MTVRRACLLHADSEMCKVLDNETQLLQVNPVVALHFALFDTASGGNMLAHGSLSVSKLISSGDTVKFAAGDLDVSLD